MKKSNSIFKATLMVVALFGLVACGGGGSGSGVGAPATSNTGSTPPVTTVNPNVSSTPVWQIPVTPAQNSSQAALAAGSPIPNQVAAQFGAAAANSANTQTNQTSGSGSTSGTNTTGSGSTNTGSSNTGSTNTGSTNGGTTPVQGSGSANQGSTPANPIAHIYNNTAMPEVYGTIPPNPTTGFNGQLFFVGSQLSVGSQIRVSYMGVPIKFLATNFVSSELLSAYVYLTIPGDYRFEAVALDGTISQGFDINIPQGTTVPTFSGQNPDIQMVYPPALSQGFVGTVWIMGENFQPGCTLIVTGSTGIPVVLPVSYVNSNTLQWYTATPLQGSMDVQVFNPDFSTSTKLTMTVSAPTSPSTNQLVAAPRVLGMTGGVLAPFFGSIRIYGNDFMPGAQLEMKNVVTGVTTTNMLSFVSSNELVWSLAYPQFGSYEVRVINPDGQATPVQLFDVN